MPDAMAQVEHLDGATADAVECAAARGWVAIQCSYSICLTEASRRLVEAR
jgi:hypothetical protein